MQKKERKEERKNKEPFLGSGAGVFNKKKPNSWDTSDRVAVL